MLYINEDKIKGLLEEAAGYGKKADINPNFANAKCGINEILEKAASLKRLTLCETATLLMADNPADSEKILKAASYIKDKIYGRRIVLFAPLYISNQCANRCLYCAFRADNTAMRRKTLSIEEIKKEVKQLLLAGHKRVLLVAGESVSNTSNADYYIEAVKAVYSAGESPHKIRRVNINCAPLGVEEFKKLKASGIGTYQLFQETYHEGTYRRVHPYGPKSDADNRIDAVDRAFLSGIDDIGIGALYGLYDYRFEALAMLTHVEHMEARFGVGPHTISVPRIEPALGSELSLKPPYAVSDDDFKRLVAILRLSVPYTGLILSTRETPRMRDELFGIGISQVSAGSRTSPGGYSGIVNDNAAGQFDLSDTRPLDEVIGSLIKKDFIPSFCAACYRKERTGRAFMNLAKPGLIKGKCNINALITLKEYLDDFASATVKKDGYLLISRMKEKLEPSARAGLLRFFEAIDRGTRDEYV